jgi:hypothetical protein
MELAIAKKHHPESKGYEATHDMKRGFDCLLRQKRLGPCKVSFGAFRNTVSP